VFTTNETYPRSFVTQIFITVNQVMVASVKLSKWLKLVIMSIRLC